MVRPPVTGVSAGLISAIQRGLAGFVLAVGFLTRVPVPAVRFPTSTSASTRDSSAADDGANPVAAAVPWFPFVGLLIGFVPGGAYYGLASVGPSLMAAAVAVAAGLLVTGAFHHDGLADIADAFGGGWTVEQRMEILKDSRLGTYGTSALAAALLIEVTAVGSLTPSIGLWALVSAHGLSRTVAVTTMLCSRLLPRLAGPPAGGGLGAGYTSALAPTPLVLSILVSACLGVVLAPDLSAGLGGLAGALVGAAAVTTLARSKIGGVTGDVLGAIQVVSMLAILVVTAAMLAP